MFDSRLVERLSDALEKEAETYCSFLDLSRQKTEVIINGNVAELENITKNEQVLVNRIGKLEEIREQIVAEIASYIQVAPSALTITSIIEKLDTVQGEKLKKTKESIINTVEEIKKINQLNKTLINNSLEYIDFSINLMTSANSRGVKYRKDGKEGNGERHSLFDIKL